MLRHHGLTRAEADAMLAAIPVALEGRVARLGEFLGFAPDVRWAKPTAAR